MSATHGDVLAYDVTGGSLYLNDTDTNSQEEERKPFCRAQPFTKERDGKRGRCKDLHLIGHLEGRDGKITDGYELERILDDVEHGRDRELPAIRTENLST